jgi:26S proteasome regulatory subunit N2
MDTEPEVKENAAAAENGDGEAKVAPKKKKGPEPTSFRLSNPSRVTPEQEKFVSFDLDQRYAPVNSRGKPAGIVILADRTPDEPQEVVQVRHFSWYLLRNTSKSPSKI